MADIARPIDEQMRHVADRLVSDFAGTVDSERIRQLVAEDWRAMGAARIQTFLPVLVDRAVRAQLRTPQPKRPVM